MPTVDGESLRSSAIRCTLAPRASLVRIATGRDAADTAFLSTYGGAATLTSMEVMAVLAGELPDDDVPQLVSIG